MTKDLGGGWRLHDTDHWGNPTHRLTWARPGGGKGPDGIRAVEIQGDNLSVDIVTTDSGWYGSKNEFDDTIPLDALAELLRASGWEVNRK